MLVDPNLEDSSGTSVMSITDEDLDSILQAVQCCMGDVMCYGSASPSVLFLCSADLSLRSPRKMFIFITVV